MGEPASAEPLITADEFAEMVFEEDGYLYELVRGVVVREGERGGPAPVHGRLQAELAYLLLEWMKGRGERGAVLTHTGYVLAGNPGTVRLPDVSYVSEARMPEATYGHGLWRMGPDLAVEVISPSNTWTEIQQRVDEYLGAGTLAVWVVDPPTRTVTAYRPGAEARRLDASADLTDEVLPGFRVPLERLFDV